MKVVIDMSGAEAELWTDTATSVVEGFVDCADKYKQAAAARDFVKTFAKEWVAKRVAA